MIHYRPISNHHTLSKILERLALTRLQLFIASCLNFNHSSPPIENNTPQKHLLRRPSPTSTKPLTVALRLFLLLWTFLLLLILYRKTTSFSIFTTPLASLIMY